MIEDQREYTEAEIEELENKSNEFLDKKLPLLRKQVEYEELQARFLMAKLTQARGSQTLAELVTKEPNNKPLTPVK